MLLDHIIWQDSVRTFPLLYSRVRRYPIPFLRRKLRKDRIGYPRDRIGYLRVAISEKCSKTVTAQMNVTSRAVSLMSVTSRAVSLMSVLSSKAILKAAHDFNLSIKVSFILSERSFVLRETVKRDRLVCSTICFFSGHA